MIGPADSPKLHGYSVGITQELRRGCIERVRFNIYNPSPSWSASRALPFTILLRSAGACTGEELA